MPIDAEAEIKCLRRGNPPDGDLRFFLVAHEPFLTEVRHQLGRIRSDAERFDVRLLVGEPGAGKSTLLGVLREEAAQSGFAVASILADEGYGVFTNSDTLVTEIFDLLRLEGPVGQGDWDSVLGLFANKVLADSHSEQLPPEGTPRSRALRELTERRLKGIDVRETSLVAACVSYVAAQDKIVRGVTGQIGGQGPNEAKRTVLGWFRGEPILVDQLRRVGIQEHIHRGNAFEVLRESTSILRLAGFGGLVLLVDEVEQAALQWSGGQRARSWTLMRRMIDGELSRVFISCAVTDDALADATKGLSSYPALASRIADPATLGMRMRDPYSLVYRLGDLEPAELTTLFGRILARHMEAYRWDGTGILGHEEAQLQLISGGGRMQARDFVKAVVGLLDSTLQGSGAKAGDGQSGMAHGKT